jgi:hypothetical protein
LKFSLLSLWQQGRSSRDDWVSVVLTDPALPGTFTEYNTEKFIKKILGENEIEAVLQRLDRLTLDEARATGAQTLEVVCGLVQHRRLVMDGERIVPSQLAAHCWMFVSLDLDDKASANSIRAALG